MVQRLLIGLIRKVLNSGLRGRTRLTMLLARLFPSLQAYPAKMTSGRTIYLDLRLVGTHEILLGRMAEESEQVVMRRFIKPGMTAFDIGAHIGVHTILLSELVGENGNVVAFEPQRHLLPALTRTIADSGNVRLFTRALSEENGATNFFLAKEASMSSLSNWTGEGEKVEVETSRLDDLMTIEELPSPDFIKCDIEGAEILCFRGGEKTINESCPIIMFEANLNASRSFNASPRDAILFLKGLKAPNYEFFEIMDNGELIELSDTSKQFTAHNDYSNILAVPGEAASRVTKSYK